MALPAFREPFCTKGLYLTDVDLYQQTRTSLLTTISEARCTFCNMQKSTVNTDLEDGLQPPKGFQAHGRGGCKAQRAQQAAQQFLRVPLQRLPHPCMLSEDSVINKRVATRNILPDPGLVDSTMPQILAKLLYGYSLVHVKHCWTRYSWQPQARNPYLQISICVRM